MTLVVGAHLGDAVGIVADTRVTHTESGGTAKFFDDALKVYMLPHCLVGIIGAAWPAATLLEAFRDECLMELSLRGEFSNVVDISWMREKLVGVFQRRCGTRLTGRERFSCVFACEVEFERTDDDTPAGALQPTKAITDSTFRSQARVLTRPDALMDKRTVFSIEFPSTRIETTRPGDVIVLGSGAGSERLLASRTSAYACPSGISLGSRIGALGIDIGTAAVMANERSFNGIAIGLAVSRGYLEATLNSFQRWPADSEPKSTYSWLPMNTTDKTEIPKSIPFAVGLDVREANVAWIYDLAESKKLCLRSFLNPTVLASMASSNGRFECGSHL